VYIPTVFGEIDTCIRCGFGAVILKFCCDSTPFSLSSAVSANAADAADAADAAVNSDEIGATTCVVDGERDFDLRAGT